MPSRSDRKRARQRQRHGCREVSAGNPAEARKPGNRPFIDCPSRVRLQGAPWESDAELTAHRFVEMRKDARALGLLDSEGGHLTPEGQLIENRLESEIVEGDKQSRREGNAID